MPSFEDHKCVFAYPASAFGLRPSTPTRATLTASVYKTSRRLRSSSVIFQIGQTAVNAAAPSGGLSVSVWLHHHAALCCVVTELSISSHKKLQGYHALISGASDTWMSGGLLQLHSYLTPLNQAFTTPPLHPFYFSKPSK